MHEFWGWQLSLSEFRVPADAEFAEIEPEHEFNDEPVPGPQWRQSEAESQVQRSSTPVIRASQAQPPTPCQNSIQASINPPKGNPLLPSPQLTSFFTYLSLTSHIVPQTPLFPTILATCLLLCIYLSLSPQFDSFKFDLKLRVTMFLFFSA